MEDLPRLLHLGKHPDTGAPLNWDFDVEPHLMITGGAGMGKTTLCRRLVGEALDVVDWYKAQGRRSKVIILDPKGGLGYRRYASRCQIIKSNWQLTNANEVWMALFAGLWKEYEYRMDLIAAVNAQDWDVDEWKGGGLGPMFVVLEEVQALMSVMVRDEEPDAKGVMKNVGAAHIAECQNELIAAASLFRGAGIRLIVISQAAHDVYIPVRAKLSMPAKIVMGTTISSGQFMAAFGESMPGDFLYYGGRGRGLSLLNGFTHPIVFPRPDERSE